MLSYQHGYHAGNFADVIKHITLSRLLHYMIQKEKPLLYLETHAGRGHYDLLSQFSLKTGEATQGIARLWEHKKNLPAVFSPWLQHLQQLNPNGNLRFYPGSPAVAIQALRATDRLVCCERHPTEFEFLQHLPHPGKRVFYQQADGLKEMHALLPPPERRGLIFIDPTYEIKDEYKKIPLAIQTAFTRFSTGVYCLWYPIVDKKHHEQLLRALNKIDAPKSLRVEYYFAAEQRAGMTGCGLWIINPPYILSQELQLVFETLKTQLNQAGASYLIDSKK